MSKRVSISSGAICLGQCASSNQSRRSSRTGKKPGEKCHVHHQFGQSGLVGAVFLILGSEISSLLCPVRIQEVQGYDHTTTPYGAG
jgi:hypothetical protein